MWWLKVLFVLVSAACISIFGVRAFHWHDCTRSFDALFGTPSAIHCGPSPFDFSADYVRPLMLNEGLIPSDELRPEELLE